jgi:LssY C-terminus
MSLSPSGLVGRCAIWLSLALAGCATWRAPAHVGSTALRDRAIVAARRDVRVDAAVLSAADYRRMFGVRLDAVRVQPIWIEIQNGTSKPLWLLRSGMDPDYYSPFEVAWRLHTLFDSGTNARIDQYFDKMAFKNPILPGETHEGILFTNPSRRTKLLNVDLFGRRTLISFTLFLPVPDDGATSNLALFQYTDRTVVDYTDLAAFRGALERLPCCATDAHGATQGDPLNVVFVGELADVASALVRRDYRRDAQAADLSQWVFGRPPDVVLRKSAQGGSPANWLRAWLAAIRFQGQSVYVVQAGRPEGGRFAPRDSNKAILDYDPDEARNLLIQDMMYSGGLSKFGFVTGVGRASETEPRSSFHEAHYYTDGLRAVLFFASRPLGLDDVEFIRWEPYLAQ